MEEKTEIIECTDSQIIISNTYPWLFIILHSLIFVLLILFGIFLITRLPVNPDSVEAEIRSSGVLITKLKGNSAILFLQIAGWFFIFLSLFALSVKKPKLVTFVREKAIITISGCSWFGVFPYQETISFNKVLRQDISKIHSAVILPLKSGKMVYIGNLSELKVIDAIIAMLR